MRALPRVGVIAAVLLGTAALSPAPAYADNHPPRLTSATMRTSSTPAAGTNVTIAWTADDEVETGSGVSYVTFGYENVDSSGAVIASPSVQGGYSPAADGTSLATTTLGEWSASGWYRLTFISLLDKTDNNTTYYRDGTVRSAPSSAAPPPAPVDFGALDFQVSNDRSDSAAPTISGLKPLSRNVLAGHPVVLTSTVRDDRSGVLEIFVSYESPSGATHVGTHADPALAAAGLTSGLLPLRAEGGHWRAVQLSVIDRAGNAVDYALGAAQPTYRPAGIRPFQPQEPIDLSALDIDVTATLPDADSPQVTELRRDSPAQLHRGDDLVVHYAVHDASPVKFVQVRYLDSSGHTFSVINQCLPESGSAVGPIPAGLDTGPVRVEAVFSYVVLSNGRYYLRDGTTGTFGHATSDPGRGPDLTVLDFELVDGPASFTGHVSTQVLCPRLPRLPLTLPSVAAPGELIDLAGQVLTTAEQVITGGTVAAFATTGDAGTELLGVLSTDSDGRCRTTATITRDTTYQVRFLGLDASAGAEAATSEPRLVRVDPNTSPSPRPTTSAGATASPASPPTPGGSPGASSGPTSPDTSATPTLSLPTVATYGSTVPVSVQGMPGAQLELWAYSRPSTTYRLVRTGTVDAAGTWTTTVRPATNTRLYVRTRTTGGWLSSTTRAVQIRVNVSLRVSAPTSTGRRTFSGTAGPALAGRLVSIYRTSASGPRLFLQVRTTSTGAFTASALTPRGWAVYDARAAATDRNAAGTSRGVGTS
jgi:hypothetical protein